MSLLRETLESGKFAVTTEMAPPKGTDLSHLIECAKPLVGRVHAANVTDFQSAVMRTTSLATCKLLKDVGLEPVLQMTGRDRNRIAIQGEMLSAGVFGIKNMLALTGDHTVVGDHPQAKGVFDLDCIGILQTAETLMGGKDLVGNELKGSPEFYLGASVTPEYAPIEIQLMKMQKKINAGAKFFQTQAVRCAHPDVNKVPHAQAGLRKVTDTAYRGHAGAVFYPFSPRKHMIKAPRTAHLKHLEY